MTSRPKILRQIPEKAYTRRLIKRVWLRLNRENDWWAATIVGREKSGKSHTALKIANVLDPKFDHTSVFYEAEDLLRALKSNAYGSGRVIVIDEAGVGMGNRSWYEEDQIKVNKALQTARDDNMGIIFTLPRLTELDSQTRGRLHTLIEMTELHEEDGYAVAKWKNIDPTRDEKDKIYKKYPILDVNGRKTKVTRVRFTPPADRLVKGYEQRKSAFKEGYYDEAIEAQQNDDEERTPEDVAMDAAERVAYFVDTNPVTGAVYINKDLLKAEYDISNSQANAAKTLLRRSFSEQQLQEIASNQETPA